MLLQSQSVRLKRADKYFQEFSYDKAIKAYESLDDKSPDVYRNLAKSYLMLGNTEKAEMNYSDLMNTGKYKSKDVYSYASILLMNKKYDEAANWLEKYYKLNPEDRRAQLFMRDPVYYRDLLKSDLKVSLEDLDINTVYEDFSPVYYKDGQVVFASSRGGNSMVNRKWNGNRQPYLDLYISDLQADNQLGDVKKFDKNINKKYHDAPATFNKEGDYMIVTRNVYNKDLRDNKLMLYESELKYGKYWSDPVPLHFNNVSYSCGQATMTPDGKLMYFVSDMPGGFGGTDLYKVERLSDGSWGVPENLGDEINTEGNEMFPYYDSKGGYLFFSSDGIPGLGGLDIFVSKVRKDGSYTLPLNLGSPINSNRDDFSFIYKEDGSGFLSSNRSGGKGDDDIYSFRHLMNFKDKIEDCYLRGTITDKETHQPLDFARVILYDEQGKELGSFETKQDGKYLYPIDCSSVYKLVVMHEGYKSERSDVDAGSFDTSDIVKDFSLLKPGMFNEGTPGEGAKGLCDIRIKPLYYDLDKYYIRYKDKVELDKIISLMNKYPQMVLEVASHTDARATKPYNVTLSHNRTNSVIEYLTTHGIKKDRLVAKWFGEIYPVNGCVDGVKCSEEQHQLNRRTEFKILNCVH